MLACPARKSDKTGEEGRGLGRKESPRLTSEGLSDVLSRSDQPSVETLPRAPSFCAIVLSLWLTIELHTEMGDLYESRLKTRARGRDQVTVHSGGVRAVDLCQALKTVPQRQQLGEEKLKSELPAGYCLKSTVFNNSFMRYANKKVDPYSGENTSSRSRLR